MEMIKLPMKATTTTPAETRTLGASLAQMYVEDSSLPPFVALYGDLGVGKTAFVSGFAEVLAPGRTVRSPTFALVNEYRVKGMAPLFHFDMYRITSHDDLYSIGYDDYLDEGICLCEWCENIPGALPDRRVVVRIYKDSSNTNLRHITIERKE